MNLDSILIQTTKELEKNQKKCMMGKAMGCLESEKPALGGEIHLLKLNSLIKGTVS
jgi:hypothetical protein